MSFLPSSSLFASLHCASSHRLFWQFVDKDGGLSAELTSTQAPFAARGNLSMRLLSSCPLLLTPCHLALTTHLFFPFTSSYLLQLSLPLPYSLPVLSFYPFVPLATLLTSSHPLPLTPSQLVPQSLALRRHSTVCDKSGKWKCMDVDECWIASSSSSESACVENSVCTNTWGNYTCSCLSGYYMSANNQCKNCILYRSAFLSLTLALLAVMLTHQMFVRAAPLPVSLHLLCPCVCSVWVICTLDYVRLIDNIVGMECVDSNSRLLWQHGHH